VKRFLYRGFSREFSNRFHIGINFPANLGAWTTLATNVMNAEAGIYHGEANGGATIVKWQGFAPGSDVPVAEADVSVGGALTGSPWIPAPGDAAMVIKCNTPDKSVKNHPIYLFSFFHTPGISVSASGDPLEVTQHTALQTYANAWLAGFSDGTRTYHRSRPNSGTLITSATAEPMITHRDLPRA
jgi:hypothetical protein